MIRIKQKIELKKLTKAVRLLGEYDFHNIDKGDLIYHSRHLLEKIKEIIEPINKHVNSKISELEN